MKCNSCGKTIIFENDIMKEDVFEAAKVWGYFSKKDMEVHKFNLCEECYDKIVEGFEVPIVIEDKSEAL